MLAPLPAPQTPGEPSLLLPRSFWKDFARKHWDREPVLYRGLFAAHFPTLDEIFAALVEASERCNRGEYPPLRILRFFIEHEDGPNGLPYYSMVFPLSPQHLPLPEDVNAEGYLARITKWLGGKRFGITLNSTQCFHWGHWLQMQSFLTGFREQVGVPLGGGDSAVFFGNYRYTPFGIHKDDLHVFYFVVEGRKTISLWPFDALSQRAEVPKDPDFIHRPGGIVLKDKAEEEKLLSQATLLRGQRGDLMYWPASYWHRAEPSEGLAVSASLGVSFRSPFFTQMGPVGGQWPERLRHTELPRGPGWRLPASLRKSLQQQAQRRNVLAVERERTAEWVRFLTGGTMEGTPPVAHEAPLSAKEWIRAEPSRPIVGVPLPGGQWMVSAHGHSTVLSPSPTVRRRLERLLAALDSGKPQSVEALEDAFFSRLTARAFSRKAFRALLDDLVRWRAVRRCEPPVSRR
ncbi:hypothetical protein KYC5002_37040 [Archangium violaceum]|uniref:hypothetical protein n=1 Tax=Archangium violaceum TaxID=83451 RepID=UPI002B2C8FA9|nr:hypothetical protein KYC5002_37040 [Archangium gephyra]